MTFLSYPEFDTDPHPHSPKRRKLTSTLAQSSDRLSRSVKSSNSSSQGNFPATEDPRVANYAALTVREEEAGLYHDPSRIGLRVQWLTLLKRLGLTDEGHELVPVRKQNVDAAAMEADKREIRRHRTAIKRYDLSKPVKQLLERGLLKKGDTFFDFGCGHGMDIEALQNLGYQPSDGIRRFDRMRESHARPSSISASY